MGVSRAALPRRLCPPGPRSAPENSPPPGGPPDHQALQPGETGWHPWRAPLPARMLWEPGWGVTCPLSENRLSDAQPDFSKPSWSDSMWEESETRVHKRVCWSSGWWQSLGAGGDSRRRQRVVPVNHACQRGPWGGASGRRTDVSDVCSGRHRAWLQLRGHTGDTRLARRDLGSPGFALTVPPLPEAGFT